MIHRAILRMREAERKLDRKIVEEKPAEEKKVPVEEKKVEKPTAPKRGRKPKGK